MYNLIPNGNFIVKVSLFLKETKYSIKVLIFTFALLFTTICFNFNAYSYSANSKYQVPGKWKELSSVLESRVGQSGRKMKLTQSAATEFVQYLFDIDVELSNLIELQKILPKTTVELIMSTKLRGVSLEEAERMALYLRNITLIYHFKNPQAFDENTSHIIGRDWHEIDYSGEPMTWQKQKDKYTPIGVKNFKTLESLKNFIPYELNLPYSRKLYHSQNPKAIRDILEFNANL